LFYLNIFNFFPDRQCLCCFKEYKHLEVFNHVVYALINLVIQQIQALRSQLCKSFADNVESGWTDVSHQNDEPINVERDSNDDEVELDGKDTVENKPDSFKSCKKTDDTCDKNPDSFTSWSTEEKEKLLLCVAKIFQIQFPLYTAYKHNTHPTIEDVEVPLHLLRYVCLFCGKHGLSLMKDCFESGTPETLPFPIAHAFITVVSNLSDQELRQSAARNMADLMWSTVKEPLDSALCFDRESLDLAFKYFMSPTLTMRLAGLSQITTLYLASMLIKALWNNALAAKAQLSKQSSFASLLNTNLPMGNKKGSPAGSPESSDNSDTHHSGGSDIEMEEQILNRTKRAQQRLSDTEESMQGSSDETANSGEDASSGPGSSSGHSDGSSNEVNSSHASQSAGSPGSEVHSDDMADSEVLKEEEEEEEEVERDCNSPKEARDSELRKRKSESHTGASLREPQVSEERSTSVAETGKDLPFSAETVSSVDNRLRLLESCSSHPDDQEHDIANELSTSRISQGPQDPCISRSGDFLGDPISNELFSCRRFIGPQHHHHHHHHHDGHIVDDMLSADDVSCSSSQVSAKSEKNMADFDGEESGCEEELVQINSHAELTSHLQQHLPNLASIYHEHLNQGPTVHKHQFTSNAVTDINLDNVCKKGNTLLWDLVQDEDAVHLSEGLINEAEKLLCSLVCWFTDRQIRMRFIEGCLENLANHRWAEKELHMMKLFFENLLHYIQEAREGRHKFAFLEQVDILWHCLVEDSECYDDALHWFLNQVRSKDQHAMGMETYKHLFLEKMPQLKPESISMTGLNLFQHLCNLARLATSTYDSGSNCELCGMDQLWGIALRAQSADVSRAAIQYINSYYINGKTGLEKEQEFISRCMESLMMASGNLEKDAHSSLTIIERGLLMLKTHLEAFRRRFAYHLRQWQIEGTGISSHLKALSDKQSLPLRIVCQPAGLPDKMTIEMYPSDQVADLRAEVTHWYENLQKEQMNQQAQLQEFGQSSRQGDFPGGLMGPVRMISSGHELTTDYDEKTLHELGFKDMQVNDGPYWKDLLRIKSPHKLLYALEIIEALGKPNRRIRRESTGSYSDLYPDSDDSSEDQIENSKNSWSCKVFLTLVQGTNIINHLIRVAYTYDNLAHRVLKAQSDHKSRHEVTHYSMWLLVSWSHCSSVVKSSLADNEHLHDWLKKLALLVPETAVRHEACNGLYKLSLSGLEGGESINRSFLLLAASTLLKFLPDAQALKPFRTTLLDLDALARHLADCIRREILDQQDGNIEDDGLTGLLRLATSVVKHKPPFKFSREGQEFLRDVYNLLFMLPSLKDRQQPKCKSHSARAAAYDLLVELVKGSVENYRLLHNWVMSQHMQSSHAPYKWDYWPHDDVRAECRFVGLTNLGATCYLASTIQQLYMIPEARQAVFTAKYAEDIKHKTTLLELQKMFTYLMESERKAYHPRPFCKTYTMDKQPLNTGEQKDMTEFFTDLITKIEEMSPELKNTVKNLFGGVITNNVVSLESLDEVTIKDTLEGDNMYTCSQCGKKVRAEKRACFKKLPRILSFNTMRYTFNMVTMMKEKVNTHFSFPIRLDMTSYTEDFLMGKSDRKDGFREDGDPKVAESYEYDLIGVTVHTGTADGGHYYSFIRDIVNPHAYKNNKWYLFNDAEVKPFDSAQLASECFGGEMTTKTYDSVTDKFMDFSFEKTHSAYMLFYKRVEPLDETGKDYKFDVSPELLEWIWHDNMQFLQDKNIFEHTYFGFMWQLCSSIPSTLPDPKAISLMTAKWFLDRMADDDWWPMQILIKCPNQIVRQMFQRLCIHVIQRLRPVHAHLYLQPGMEDGSDDMDGPVEDIGSRSCVTRFVKTLLSIMEHGVKPHSKHLTEYFAFLYEFAKMGEEEVEVLSEEEGEEEEEEEDILSLAEEKYRPAALEKMIALIALLVEQHLTLSQNDMAALTGGKAANPFFKLLTMLMEFAGGPPGMPSFATYILQRIWEVIEYNPSQCLDWLAVQTPRNKLAHSWVLQNMENWVERFLLAHNYPRVRTSAAYLLVSLIPSNSFRQMFRSTRSLHIPTRDLPLSPDTTVVLHQVYNVLLGLLSRAKLYVDAAVHGTTKLMQYFSFMTYCLISKTEKLMFSSCFMDLWNLFQPKLSEPAIATNHNKQALLSFWYNVCVDCPENVRLIVQNPVVTKNIAFNYILADHDDQDVVLFNRGMLPAYYGILRMCCEQSPNFTRQLASHQNIQWAFKNLTPHASQYPGSFNTLHMMYHEATACHVTGDLVELLSIFLSVLKATRPYLQRKDVLKELVLLSPHDFLHTLVPFLQHNHCTYHHSNIPNEEGATPVKRRRVSSEEDHTLESCPSEMKSEPREALTPTSTSDTETRDSSVIDPGTEQDPPTPENISVKDDKMELSSSVSEETLFCPKTSEEHSAESKKEDKLNKEEEEVQSSKTSDVTEEDPQFTSISVFAGLTDMSDLKGCDNSILTLQDPEISITTSCVHSRGLFSFMQKNDILDTLCRTLESTIGVVSKLSGKGNRTAS
ncbi:UBP34 hydrolase, partial [Polypterus senegalus]